MWRLDSVRPKRGIQTLDTATTGKAVESRAVALLGIWQMRTRTPEENFLQSEAWAGNSESTRDCEKACLKKEKALRGRPVEQVRG